MELDEVMSSLDRGGRHWHGLKGCQDSHAIPTGSLGLDIALGGGLRRGQIAELSGDFSTYKSIFALHTVAQAQRLGRVLWVESASDFNPNHARLAGVEVESLVVCYPDTAEGTMFTLRVAAQDYALMVVDSASGLDFSPDTVAEREFARLKAILQETTTTVLFISNDRATSDQVFTRELRKWSAQQVRMVPETGYGRVEAVVTKNHGAPPKEHRNHFRFLLDASFDREFELIKLGLEAGVLHRRGSWIYSDNDLLIGQGVDDAVNAIRDGRVINNHLDISIRAALR